MFFFDGFAQYLPPNRLHLCYQWDKITLDLAYKGMYAFYGEYFSQYPQRLMLRLKEGDAVQLERFQDVFEARVVQVDCSLVKVHRHDICMHHVCIGEALCTLVLGWPSAHYASCPMMLLVSAAAVQRERQFS